MRCQKKPREQHHNLPIEEIWDELVQQRREALAQKKRCIDAMLAAGRNRRKPSLSEQQMQHWEGLR